MTTQQQEGYPMAESTSDDRITRCSGCGHTADVHFTLGCWADPCLCQRPRVRILREASDG